MNRKLLGLSISGFLFSPALAMAAASFPTGGFNLAQNQNYSFGSYVLKMQPDGNAVIYQGSNAVWSTGTGGQNCSSGQCHMAFQTDGNLVVYNGSTPLWSSFTSGSSGSTFSVNTSAPLLSIASADGANRWASTSVFSAGNFILRQNDFFSFGFYQMTMQSDGNLIVRNAGQPLWASNTSSPCNNLCIANFQPDGNLVLYNGSAPYWSSNTAGNPGASLALSNQGAFLEMFSAQGSNLWSSSPSFMPGQFVINQNDSYQIGSALKISMQNDGNLVVYNGANAVWASGSSVPGQCGSSNNCHAVYQADGNFVVYRGSTPIWSTGTENPHTSADFLSFQSQAPYLNIIYLQKTNDYCHIYPIDHKCQLSVTFPVSLATAGFNSGAGVSGTIASSGVNGSYASTISIGSQVNDYDLASSNSPTDNANAALLAGYAEGNAADLQSSANNMQVAESDGYVMVYNMATGESVIVPAANPIGEAAGAQYENDESESGGPVLFLGFSGTHSLPKN